MDRKPETKSHFSLKELSGQLGVSYRHLHRAVKLGKIRTVRFGNVVRVPEKEKARLMEHGF